jgi:RimJ/RimL family protein N-acetyltransferase
MLDFNFHITTPRLTLSYLDPSNAEHVDFIYELNNTPEMLATNRNLPNPFTDREAALKFIEPNITSLEKTGYGKFLISRPPDTASTARNQPFTQLLNTHTFIGIVSLQVKRHPSAPTIPDIGFAILAKYYGQGYATEAAEGLMKYYREERAQTEFAGFCDPGNEQSKKMLRRLGFKELGVRQVNGLVGEGVEMKCLVFAKGWEGQKEGMRDVEGLQ